MLDRCKLSEEGIHSLFEEVDEKALSVTTLCFYGKPVLEQCILLNKCLKKLESLVTLDLSNANLGSKKVEQLLQCHSSSSSHTLNTSTISKSKTSISIEVKI